MLTFPNIFNNLIGTFPNVFAKNASGTGSTDGSEYKKTVVDELWFGWIQALLTKVSQTPDGVPETATTSQIFDAMREAFNTPEFQSISASGPVVFGKTNHQIELDVSLGNVDIDALDLSDFIGQHIHFYAVGSGIASIAGGNGVYVNDIFITANTGGAHLWGVSGGLWNVDNGVTADYVSGSDRIKQWANGWMKNRHRTIISFSASALATGSGSYVVQFTLIDHSGHNVTDTSPTCGTSYSDDQSLTTWTHKISTFGATTTAGSNGDGITEGKY